MSKENDFQHATCTNRVMAAPILSEGQVGVTQGTTIGRSLARIFRLVIAGHPKSGW